MKTCKEMALIWNISVRAVSNLCKSGRIPGAVKNGKNWEIPDEATKPVDGRISSGEYCKKGMSTDRKSLPIGISDYVRAQSDYYYVDKTLLIKEFLDRKPLVSLFTRPRRFGKTLNMDMLRVFFEISDEDTSIYFKEKAIWKCGQEYTRQQGNSSSVYVSDNEFIICPIADEDRDNYVELHRQINGEHTLFLNEHCKDMMWEQVLEGEDKVFSVFEINGDYCGSLELQNPDSDTPEIGIDLFENKRNKGIAPKVVKLLAKRCYKDRKVDYFLIRRTEFISQAIYLDFPT